MKKAIEFIKANKSLAVIILLVIALIVIVAVFYDGGDGDEGEGGAKSSTEIKLESILSDIDGVGESSVLVTEGDDGIEGVVIVCSGADNIMTRNNIINAVATALNIQKNIIAVYAMDK